VSAALAWCRAERKPISAASKSICRFASARRRCDAKAVVTSRAISVWVASAVFSLRCSRILGRSGTADLFIHLDEGSLQLTITAEGLDPPLGLGLLGRRGEALADSLAFHLVSQPGMRTMTRSENLTARKSASGLRPAFVPDRQTGDASCQPSVSHTLTNRRPKKETYRFPTFLSPISRA